VNPDHLIELAEQILQIGTGYPRQATINRAVSTAYYALFHALSQDCVARTIRSPRSSLYWSIVTPIYRAIEHASARRVFDRITKDVAAFRALREVAEAFLELQSARIAADYDPRPENRLSRKEAVDLLQQGRAAIDALRSMPKDHRLLLAVQLITKPR